jgi:signal transduction histidine kinase
MAENANQFDISTLLDALRLSEERSIAGLLALEVMHEVRNPLEALTNLLFLTKEEADNPDHVREYMRLADEQMLAVTEITRRTLGYARSASRYQSVELVSVTESALRIHQRTIDKKGLRLIKDLRNETAASISQGEILQVISNLIVNAVEALPQSGTLYIRVRKNHDDIRITVADNGTGIPVEHYTDIFQPFFTTKTERGTGLGLALSKRIIDRHQGRISLRSSTASGKSGTVFRVSLPIQSHLAV